LTDVQRKKMNELNEERGKKVRQICEDKDLTRQKKVKADGEVYREYQKKLNEIYTPEQLKKRKERRGSICVLPRSLGQKKD
tara:strand:- start:523 stop:765 length:243 start_codon:yes stop_codon:yes gene_type:complete